MNETLVNRLKSGYETGIPPPQKKKKRNRLRTWETHCKGKEMPKRAYAAGCRQCMIAQGRGPLSDSEVGPELHGDQNTSLPQEMSRIEE